MPASSSEQVHNSSKFKGGAAIWHASVSLILANLEKRVQSPEPQSDVGVLPPFYSVKLHKMGQLVDMEPSKNAVPTQHSSVNQLKSLQSLSEIQQQKSWLIDHLMSTGLDLAIGDSLDKLSELNSLLLDVKTHHPRKPRPPMHEFLFKKYILRYLYLGHFMIL